MLAWEEAHIHGLALAGRLDSLDRLQEQEREAILAAEAEVVAAAAALEQLQAEVKTLGEDQLLAVQAELAGLETSGRELARQAERHGHQAEELQRRRQELQQNQAELRQQRQAIDGQADDGAIAAAEALCREAEAAVELSRRRLGEVAGRSGSWLEEQQGRSRRRQELQEQLAPLLAERQQLEERLRQADERLQELGGEEQEEDAAHAEGAASLAALAEQERVLRAGLEDRQRQAQELAEALALQQRTRARLEQEQTSLEREIARLDSRRETLQESRGTGALRLLLEAGLEGIHGSVAQLGEVEERLRVALEVAAGGRLAQVVVEDDRIAALAIELLKQRRAGRLTFLPLNRIRGGSGGGSGGGSAGAALQRGNPGTTAGAGGLVGRAVELIRHEPVYADVFRYVFGDTLVFATLSDARRELGRCRAVTLEGRAAGEKRRHDRGQPAAALRPAGLRPQQRGR